MPVRPGLLPNDGEGFAPITLARKEPVAQFVIDRALTETAFLQPRRNFSNRLTRLQPVDDRRIDRNAVANESDRILARRRLNNLSNRQIEFARKFEVAFDKLFNRSEEH